ncbi:unnamed protein product [Didymodactylos carnosus]|uniref:Uncharacterized protein n=1 Tax=Didymodactylos carnosus TaxID=1234261 RepID=A0A815PLA6_9BILA|nr:unnamed protein product [Didymodactylos carnosus]CAF4324275.1 unnamed protein product [Didymodactylos carnosus]
MRLKTGNVALNANLFKRRCVDSPLCGITCPFTPAYKSRFCKIQHLDPSNDVQEATANVDLDRSTEYDEPEAPPEPFFEDPFDLTDPDDQPPTKCNTDKETHEKNPRSAAAIFNCGIIFALCEIYGSESTKQLYAFMANVVDNRQHHLPNVLAFDNARKFSRFARNTKKNIKCVT